MSTKTVAKTSFALVAMTLTVIQLQSVLMNKALGVAPLTAPLTNFVTITPTPTIEVPLTAPVQTTPTETPTPTQAPSNNNGGGSSNNGGSNGGGNNGGGSSNNGGSSGGGSSICRDERPKSAPIIISARATGANQVTLTWRKGWAPFNGFVISYSTKRGISQFTTEVGNTTVATVNGLNGNTLYYFKIQAKNGCVTGDYSRELSVRTSGRSIVSNKILGSKIKKVLPAKAVKPLIIKKKNNPK